MFSKKRTTYPETEYMNLTDSVLRLSQLLMHTDQLTRIVARDFISGD